MALTKFSIILLSGLTTLLQAKGYQSEYFIRPKGREIKPLPTWRACPPPTD